MTPHAKNDDLILQALAIPGWYETYVEPKFHLSSSGCWLWTASLCTSGYAQVAIPRRLSSKMVVVRGSRVIWIHLRGEIPPDYVLDHDGPNGCSNRTCVNPECMQAVTIYHNTVLTGNGHGAFNNQKEMCPEGHPLSGVNLVPSQSKRGGRQCLQCSRRIALIRARTVSAAAHHLGLQNREYKALYGGSRSRAQAVLDNLGQG